MNTPLTAKSWLRLAFPKPAGVTRLALCAVLIAGCASKPPEEVTKSYTFNNMRDTRYYEILVVKRSGVEVYNTTGMNDCPAQLWNALDTEKLKTQEGALKVEKNGPHFWMMDSMTASFGQTVSFGGIEARWVESIPLAVAEKAPQGAEPYKVFTGKKTQKMVYAKGKPVYEIIDPTATSTSCRLTTSRSRSNRSRNSASS